MESRTVFIKLLIDYFLLIILHFYIMKSSSKHIFMVKKSLDLELKLWSDFPVIAGVDEAGRGALAGSVIVAAVILPVGFQNPLIQDSKILSPSQRKKVYRINWQEE